MSHRKKIIFIEPLTTQEHIFTEFNLPRLGIFILGTMMKERGWDVKVKIGKVDQICAIDFSDVSIVGISTITPTANEAYAIGDHIRSLGTPVVMGGPHVTFMPEEALQHADYVIRGEGEMPLQALIDAFEAGKGDFRGVPNLSYVKSGKIRHNPMNPHAENLDRFPAPDFSLLDDPKYIKVIPVQTSRGCPYDCSFCSVTGMFGRKYRFRSTGHILDELRRYKGLGKMIFFYDDHFAANRKRAKELLRAMIDEGLTFKFSTQVRTEIARDRELLELMKKAGCHTLFIGFESVNPESLKEMKKSQTVEDIVRAIDVIHSYGIHIHGMFVYGFDGDTPASVMETVRFAKRLRLTSVQYLLLTPFPGSQLSAELRDRIVFHNWNYYDTHHIVFRPKNFTLRGIQDAQVWSHGSFYSIKETLRKALQRRWIAAGIGLYARGINQRWKRDNVDYLKKIDELDASVAAAVVTSPKAKGRKPARKISGK